MSLADERKKIDRLNSEIAKLLVKRFEIADSISQIKQQNGLPILNKNREKEVLKKLTNVSDNNKYQEKIENIFIKIMDETKKAEEE
ncbi:chorismate mutase [Fructilactobacillus vespulae]|uniref:chorismate mutase n=1 Tax=Fructilactobacillus vespulae TaxID=1249630 RepID=UPI0039B695AC